jgi:hypothetical protein
MSTRHAQLSPSAPLFFLLSLLLSCLRDPAFQWDTAISAAPLLLLPAAAAAGVHPRRSGGALGGALGGQQQPVPVPERASSSRRRRRRRRRRGKPPTEAERAARRLAKRHNKEAIAHASRRDLQGALRAFRAAHEAQPRSAEYLNNLGVTYMRLKQYHKAESVLRAATALDPDHADAAKNFKELREYMPDSLLSMPARRPQLHRRRAWTRIPLRDFVDLENRTMRPYREGKLPFVLTGAIDHWTRAYEHWTLEYFAEQYPHAFVEHYSRNMYRESVKPTFTPMRQAFEDMTAPNSTLYREKPGTYVQWNLDLETWNKLLDDAAAGQDPGLPAFFTSDDLWLEDCLGGIQDSAKRAAHRRRQMRGEFGADAEKNALVTVETTAAGGEEKDADAAAAADDADAAAASSSLSTRNAGSASPAMREVDSNGFARDSLEKDGDRSLASQFLIGSHWRMLLIGSEGAGMFNHRDILRSSSWQAQISGRKRWHVCDPSQDDYMYYAGEVDTFDPDYDKFPKARELDCIDDWVVPGEMLFYPRDYWHHTEVTVDTGRNESISFTGTLTDAQNFDGMIDEFARECGLPGRDGEVSQKGRRIPLNAGVCERMPQCIESWERMWGKANKSGVGAEEIGEAGVESSAAAADRAEGAVEDDDLEWGEDDGGSYEDDDDDDW